MQWHYLTVFFYVLVISEERKSRMTAVCELSRFVMHKIDGYGNRIPLVRGRIRHQVVPFVIAPLATDFFAIPRHPQHQGISC